MRFSFLFYILLSSLVYAQNQENVWYFSQGVGVNFNTSPPTSLTNGKLDVYEGSASIADADGNLLFYTDGSIIYRRDHAVMDNGIISLDGSWGYWSGTSSTTQAALIVPRPNHSNLYYVFSLNALGRSLYLAEVDMAQDGGFGRVTSKRTVLEDVSTEKLTGIYHENGRDIWVLTHSLKDTFNVYLVSPTGVAAQPKQIIGSSHQGLTGSIGYMKVSHDGRRLALAVTHAEFIELFDFDKATGQISNPVRINNPSGYGTYGLEFSPDNRFLYAGERSRPLNKYNLIQYNLTSPDIASSKTVVLRETTRANGTLQMAPNQKIYLMTNVYQVSPTTGNSGTLTMISIDNPNVSAPNLRINTNAISLNVRGTTFLTTLGSLGLPNFVRGLTSTVKMSSTCAGSPIQFELTGALSVTTAVWNFGDGSPVVNALKPQHTYTTKGLYTVTVNVTYTNGRTKTLTQVIEITDNPALDLFQP